MAAERKFIAENLRRVLLKEYLMKEVSRAGFGGLDVQRTPMGTSVILATERPGLVIGRRGQTIKTLTTVIEERFGFENPQIEVHEVEDPNLNAQIMAEKLAYSLERGWHFRRAGHSSVRRIMEAGAKGCHIIIAGKLTGQRKRTEKFKDGYIKFCGEPKIMFMSKGYAVAKMKQGIIGVTVEIMRADARLPADITVKSVAELEEAQALARQEPVEEDLNQRPKKNDSKPQGQRSERPKKAPAKKDEPSAEAGAAPASEEKPKKVPARKPKAEAGAAPAEEKPKVEAEPAAEEKPKKAPAKKPAKKDEPAAEAGAAPAEEKPKAEAEPAAEEKPKKAPARKPKAEAGAAPAEEKPKKAPAKKTAKKEE